MLNIAICDDDDLIAHQIESVLHNIGDEENVKIPMFSIVEMIW